MFILPQLRRSALTAVAQTLNVALESDPAAGLKLEGLNGKVVLLESTLPRLKLYVAVDRGRLHLHDRWDNEPDTVLRGSLTALAATTIQGSNRTSLADSGVSATGDEEVLRQLSLLMKTLDVDWEALLAQVVGDVPAHLAGNSVRAARAWAGDNATRLGHRIQLAATEELRLLPARAEAEQWRREVQRLREDVDRLAARITLLGTSSGRDKDP